MFKYKLNLGFSENIELIGYYVWDIFEGKNRTCYRISEWNRIGNRKEPLSSRG